MIKKWETVSKAKAGDFRIFDVYWIRRRQPECNKESDFVVLDSPRWVNIIPITSDNKVVLVEQYRQGIDEITLEIPGGLIEDSEGPKEAGERECREETGFSSVQEAELIGINHPNPAFLNNQCWSYVWFNCEKTGLQVLDKNEDINVLEVPIKAVKQMIIEGRIRHSIVLTAFFFFSLKYDF